MTMPCERFRSVKRTREFLSAINRGEYTDLDDIREEAYCCLRHFPGEYHMNEVVKKCPDIFEEPDQMSWVIYNKGQRTVLIGTRKQAERYCVLNGPDFHIGDK